MLTEIYVRKKLRKLEAEINDPLLYARVSRCGAFTARDSIRVAGMALRRMGQRLGSWLLPSAPYANGLRKLARPISDSLTHFYSRNGHWHE